VGILKAKWVLIVVASLVVGAVLGIFWWFSTDAPAVDLNIGSAAPLFSLSDVEGKTVSLKQLRGKAVFVTFMATWCPQCTKEVAALQAFSTQQEAVAVLFITMGEFEAVVGGYVKSHGITFPVLLDKSGNVAQRYQVRAVPDLWVLNPDGTIWGHFMGPVNLELLQNIIITMGVKTSGT